jgi:hypothetical protein
MAKQISLKQIAIDKNNSAIVMAVGLASFIIVFTLVASNALLKQRSYQSDVIKHKKEALSQLDKNIKEIDKLKISYQTFAAADQNILGGSAKGNGEKDGENPRIILDALPSKYDFPALATSLDKVFKKYGIESISGVDDEITQAAQTSSGVPTAVEIPFSMTVRGSSGSLQQILETYEQSIRPMQIQKLNITGSSAELKISVTGTTYYQPQKKFEIKSEQVKKK